MKIGWKFISLCVALLAAATVARAHSDFEIGRDAADPAHGNLKVEYEFDATVIGVDYTGFGSLFQAEDPGFFPAGDEPPEIFEIDHGTEVEIEIVHTDPGVSLSVGMATLANPGDRVILGTHTGVCSDDLMTICNSDSLCALLALGSCVTNDPEESALHGHHPFRLNLAPLASDRFGEGRISFKIKEGAGSSVGYGESATYTLMLSNGYLPGPDYGVGPAIDTKSLACQKAVGAQTRTLMNQANGIMRACLDKVANYNARNAVAHPSTASALAAAEKACADAGGVSPDSKTLLGKLEAARTAAISAIEKKCGTPGGTTIDGKTIPASASDDLSQTQVQTHVGMVQCRIEELLGAAYFGATDSLEEFNARASQGGDPLNQYFPCLRTRQGAD